MQAQLQQMFTSACLFALGDTIAQKVETWSKLNHVSYNYSRTARLFGFAFLVFTPLTIAWFNQLDAWFPGGEEFSSVVWRVALDQLLWAPLILSLMFASLGLLEGKSPQQALADVRRTILPTLKANWCVWPLVQLVNFALIQDTYSRVLFCNIVSIPWNVYLAWQANQKAGPTASIVPKLESALRLDGLVPSMRKQIRVALGGQAGVGVEKSVPPPPSVNMV